MKNILKLLNFTYDSNRENFYQLMYAIYAVHLYKTIDVLIFFFMRINSYSYAVQSSI